MKVIVKKILDRLEGKKLDHDSLKLNTLWKNGSYQHEPCSGGGGNRSISPPPEILEYFWIELSYENFMNIFEKYDLQHTFSYVILMGSNKKKTF